MLDIKNNPQPIGDGPLRSNNQPPPPPLGDSFPKRKKFRVTGVTKSFKKMHTSAINWLTNFPSGTEVDFEPDYFGPLFWHLLHTYMAHCPETPGDAEVQKIVEFYNRFMDDIPCASCREDFKKLNDSVPYSFIEFARKGKHVLSYFAWLLHNHVNKKLNKRIRKISEVSGVYGFDHTKIGDHNITQLKEYNLL